ncbi:MAG: hypothetical protein IJR72_01995 [Oscillospiraceae bacterium]|nr:hypothetical protein [Oscillospiraceae bacterium]
MKGKMKKLLCLLCALTLLLASSAFATDVERAYNSDADGLAQEESGLCVLTGFESASGQESAEETEPLPSSIGYDAQSAEETVSTSGEIPPDGDALLADSATLSASPALTLSATTLSKKVGETGSVTVRVSGYPSGAYLQASNSNSQAFSCVWGDWYGSSIPIRITGKKQGSGTLTVRLRNASHKLLASATVRVTMVTEKPTLSFSPASLNVKAGGSQNATLTLRNYSGGGSVSASVANGSICSIRWGSWSGKTIPITVTGKSAGNTKVTVRLYNTAKTELTSVTLNVAVAAAANMSVSVSSVSVNAGESAMLTATADGTLNNGDYFQYTASDSSMFGVTRSGNAGKSVRLVVTGKKAGSGTLTITLNSQSGTVLDRKSIAVKVAAKPNNQRVSVSPASVTTQAGSSVTVNCTGQNVDGAFSLRYANNAPSVLSCAWGGSWSGNTLPLTITGQAAGNGSVTIELLVGGVVRSNATIQVKVQSGGGGNSGQSPSYSFDNYSKPGISLALCQYMFGNNQRARTVYSYDIGNGGVCFGLSATAGMLSSPNAPSPDAFSKTSMRDLQKSNYSGTLNMPLSDFIEAMHIAQVANTMNEESGISGMVSAVRNGGTNQPVIICMRGPGGGHAILAYGLTSSGSLRVYDSNYPLQERTLNISGNNWSYNISSNTTWNQNNAQISYIPYATYTSVWRNRGSLNGTLSTDGTTNLSRYLLATTADNFSLMVFDEHSQNYEREVAAYENGVLIRHDDTVEEAFVSNVPLDAGNQTSPHMLYIPGEDLYTVHNRGGNMDVTLSGTNLSIRVNAEAETFDLAVSDNEEFACAMLNGLEEGQHYSISLGASIPGIADETTIEGNGNGQPVCLGLGASGDLGFGMEGLYVSGGDNGATLSISDMDGERENNPFKLDFTVNSTNYDTEYPLTAEAGEGGIILESPDSHRSVNSVLEGGNYTYRVQPEAGYTLKAIYVNGVEAAYAQSESGQPVYTYYDGAYEYTFRDVREPGYLYAEFAKDISACQVRGDYDAGNPTVTVTDGDKILTEGVDYEWSVSRVEENGEQKTFLVVHALPGGAYSGASLTTYDFHVDINDPVLIPGTCDPATREISLTARNTDNPVIVAAAYDENGKMLAFLPNVRTLEKTADGIPARISLDAAGLPESYVVRAFLLSDMDAMRPLCDPVEIPVTT